MRDETPPIYNPPPIILYSLPERYEPRVDLEAEAVNNEIDSGFSSLMDAISLAPRFLKKPKSLKEEDIIKEIKKSKNVEEKKTTSKG